MAIRRVVFVKHDGAEPKPGELDKALDSVLKTQGLERKGAYAVLNNPRKKGYGTKFTVEFDIKSDADKAAEVQVKPAEVKAAPVKTAPAKK